MRQNVREDSSDLVSVAESEVAIVDDERDLDAIRVRYLGRKGLLREKLKAVVQLPVQERAAAGAHLNREKKRLEKCLEARKQELQQDARNALLHHDALDVTLPGRRRQVGKHHPLSHVMERIESLFQSAGYEVVVGPEIEDIYHNFTALNIPEQHPARAMHDTFHILDDENLVLRTHTSPVQVRVMEARKPPIRIICPGKTFRVDSDLTHTPMFHQVEGMVIDRNVSLADLKGVLQDFLQRFFARELVTRFRPSYFPFTEPSAETDIRCTQCDGQGCRTCSESGWIEVMGSGMMHPEVLEMSGIDSEMHTGFAFGFGVERLAMLLYKLHDIRQFFENDLDFLEQFSH